MIEGPLKLASAVELGRRVASPLSSAGVGPGMRVAVIGPTSNSYLIVWLALVFAGSSPALINPDYPEELLAEMIADLDPGAVVWLHREPLTTEFKDVLLIDASAADRGVLHVFGVRATAAASEELPGLDRAPLDVAGLMHTSGTTGVPKFCEQSHAYFLGLGSFVADAMGITSSDTVFAPLPMFHINPLGYGLIGGLTGKAEVLGTAQFSASAFWALVRDAEVTVLVLHAPPVEILKRATPGEASAGHRVDRVFFADAEFLETFGIPKGFSGYGSTEAGGLSHLWEWYRGQRATFVEGMSRYGGRARGDLECRVLEDGEIAVRGRTDGVLFSGYRHRDGLTRPFDEDGWFRTGDLGRIDAAGNLVFIERGTDSIRVKGEFVPIGFVEQRFSTVAGITDLALWRREGELVDDDVVLYVVAEEVPLDDIRMVAESLPRFMRPACVAVVKELPRDTGVGKVQRRLLDLSSASDVLPL